MAKDTPLACLTQLWRAVLLAGLRDALSPAPIREHVEWIGSQDFETVCDYADVDPSAALDAYKQGVVRQVFDQCA